MKSFFAFLQQIGRSLMLPVSVLPVAGILLCVGQKLKTTSPLVAQVMEKAGGSIFGNLALFFAIGVALGFANSDGVAAVAAVVGFFVMLSTMGVVAEFRGLELKTISGVQTLETGTFGGILAGLLAGLLFRRFYRIELPPYLGFFGGKRFVPIVTGLAAVALGLVMSVVWPPIQHVIDIVSHYVAHENPALSVGVYGVVERALIPFGLHHIWNNPFFFQIGSYTNAAGEVFHGDIDRFLNGDPTAGILGGAYLFKMWGLPAAAIAMWHTALPERRKEIGGIMISAAFTSFLTGITEPIEFAFLFLAPGLYALHALLAGSTFWLSYTLGMHYSTTFSHGLIDYLLLWDKAQKPWLVLILGPLYALLYYGIFRTAIQWWNLKTPGREDDVKVSQAEVSNQIAPQVLQALGGAANLATLDACITRLRVTVKAISQVDQAALKHLGAAGVLVVGDSLQAIFGTRSENLKTDIEALLQQKGSLPLGPPSSNDLGGALHLPGEPLRLPLGPPSSPAPTPSRPAQEQVEPLPPPQAERLLRALGGRANLIAWAPVAVTRLRLQVRQPQSLDAQALKDLGVRAIQPVAADTVHLIIGPDSSRWNKTLEVA